MWAARVLMPSRADPLEPGGGSYGGGWELRGSETGEAFFLFVAGGVQGIRRQSLAGRMMVFSSCCGLWWAAIACSEAVCMQGLGALLGRLSCFPSAHVLFCSVLFDTVFFVLPRGIRFGHLL